MSNNAGKKGKKAVSAVLVLVVIAGLAAAYFLTEDYRAYTEGVKLLESRAYGAAAEIFEEIPDYKDSAELYRAAKYGIAEGLMDKKDYDEAVEILKEIADYSDSGEKISECYYKMAEQCLRKDENDGAYEYFILSGDYLDAAERADEAIYAKGHDAFMDGDYDEAFECFDRLEGEEEDYGHRHFRRLEDAEKFLDSKLDDLEKFIKFYIAEELEGEKYEDYDGVDVYTEIINYIDFHAGTAYYYEEEKQVTIQVTTYYQGEIILDAWENGDTSELTDLQKEVLDAALEVVEQANAETGNDLELEKWLHDWLCRRVEYDSPNMDVNTVEFVALRQLNCIGAILDGRANCQGYTDAFYLLGNLAGLDVGIIFGDAGGGHMWNSIKLDGKRYIVDVTFDDNSEEDCGGWFYTYFNIPWDTEVYAVDGGAQTIPAMEFMFNKDVSYFGMTDCCFDNTKDAAKNIVGKLKADGHSWAHAMVEGKEVSWDDADKALDEVRGSFGSGTTWWIFVDYYAGNSYISVIIE